MNITASGKTLYVAISDNYAIRIRALTKPKATIMAALVFSKKIKNWTPKVGGIVEKAHSKEVRKYLSEHVDVKWLNGGAPIDG